VIRQEKTPALCLLTGHRGSFQMARCFSARQRENYLIRGRGGIDSRPGVGLNLQWTVTPQFRSSEIGSQVLSQRKRTPASNLPPATSGKLGWGFLLAAPAELPFTGAGGGVRVTIRAQKGRSGVLGRFRLPGTI
jgi:hypothetical protein